MKCFFFMKGSLAVLEELFQEGTDSKTKIIDSVVADSLDHSYHLKRHWRLFCFLANHLYLSSLCLCIFLIFHTNPVLQTCMCKVQYWTCTYPA